MGLLAPNSRRARSAIWHSGGGHRVDKRSCLQLSSPVRNLAPGSFNDPSEKGRLTRAGRCGGRPLTQGERRPTAVSRRTCHPGVLALSAAAGGYLKGRRGCDSRKGYWTPVHCGGAPSLRAYLRSCVCRSTGSVSRVVGSRNTSPGLDTEIASLLAVEGQWAWKQLWRNRGQAGLHGG